MRIPIANIYYLLCYAWNRLREKDIVSVSTTDCKSLLDLFARVLIVGMTHLLKRGLDRGYVHHAEDSRCLRGKLSASETIITPNLK
jgi:5-methylcytosine-specific restriction enzyme subunit McrC